ncbi:helix-turn-helix domain-containing protein [Euzebya sp.]|uniref:helix-turn-helix domain-containing protein n=1 Tax=Euzebya sp. TaxID=1971409 RepID=UPI0035129FC7
MAARDAVEVDRRVEALTRLGQVLTSTADYEAALEKLIATISELLDVESAGFMLFDPATAHLVLQQPAFGISDPSAIRAYRVPVSGHGNAVRVFTTQRPYVTNDAPTDSSVLAEYVSLYAARNICTVPLVVEDRAIGVCHAINKRGDFSDADLALFTAMAPLLAVSVQSAALFRDVRAQRERLERAVFLQAQLSRTAFEAPGLHSMTARLADLVDRPVMVLDPGLRPLAAARWPDSHSPRDDWIEGASPDVIDAQDSTRPRVVPIAVGAREGGYLAVLDPAGALDDIDAGAIEHAATIFALEMLRERTAVEAESRVHSDMMGELFDAAHRDEREAMQLLEDLGYTMPGPWRVARVRVRWPGGRRGGLGDEVQPPQVRMHPLVRQRCLEVLEAAAAAPWRAGFLILLPATVDEPDADAEIAARLLAELQRTAEEIRHGSGVAMAVSSPAVSPSELGARLGEAEQGLAIARRIGAEDRPLMFEHLGVYQVLLGGGGQREHARFVDAALGPLVAHDERHGTELVATLRGYVAADYNAAAASRALFVHPNTLAYRLRTIRRLLAGDPSKGDLRLQVELAFRLADLAPAGGHRLLAPRDVGDASTG